MKQPESPNNIHGRAGFPGWRKGEDTFKMARKGKGLFEEGEEMRCSPCLCEE